MANIQLIVSGYLKLLLDHRKPGSGIRRKYLDLSIERGDPELLRVLLNHPSCDLRTGSDRILSVALLSAVRPSVEAVKVIVEAIESKRGAAELQRHFVYDTVYGPTTAIMVLMKARYLRAYQREAGDVIDYLVAKGCPADGSARNGEEQFPVHEALTKPRVLRQLLLNGCSLAGTERQSLLQAAATGRTVEPAAVRYLLAFGCRLREGERLPEAVEHLYNLHTARMPSLMELARTAFLRTPVRGHKLKYLEQLEACERSVSGESDRVLLPEAVTSFIRDWDKDIEIELTSEEGLLQ